MNLAESWGFEYFYTIITPEVSSSSYDITYYLTSFYDTLFEYNSEGEVVGVLAEDWSMSEDGMVYTFQIKQGVKFSDGSDLTAEDVAKSILAVPASTTVPMAACLRSLKMRWLLMSTRWSCI